MDVPFFFGLAYKFCSAATLPLIVGGRKLRFSRADTFNDAFELSPFLMPLNWNELIDLKKTQPELVDTIAAQAFHRVCGSLYITCFSKNYLKPTSQLMWAHYGASHSGACLCVDFSAYRPKGTSDGIYPVEVIYSTSLFDERRKRSPNSPDLGMLVGATKSNVWEYEEEVRLVIETDSFDPSKFDKSSDSKTIDVVFDPKCITKVVFGLKSTEGDIKTAVDSFRDVRHSPLFTRLEINPLTLDVVERDLGITT
jgi:hypothetical protein